VTQHPILLRITQLPVGRRASGFVVCWACATAWRCKSSGQPDGGEGL